MKRMEEVIGGHEKESSPMELACATIDMMARAIRVAVEHDDRASLNNSLRLMRSTVDMLQRWTEESTN